MYKNAEVSILGREAGKTFELLPPVLVVLSVIWLLFKVLTTYKCLQKMVAFFGTGLLLAYSIGQATEDPLIDQLQETADSYKEEGEGEILDLGSYDSLQLLDTAADETGSKPAIFIIGWTGMLLATIPGMYVTWPFG